MGRFFRWLFIRSWRAIGTGILTWIGLAVASIFLGALFPHAGFGNIVATTFSILVWLLGPLWLLVAVGIRVIAIGYAFEAEDRAARAAQAEREREALAEAIARAMKEQR